MPFTRTRLERRDRQRKGRKRTAEALNEREARQLQANAALRRHLRSHGRNQRIAYAMFALSAIIGISHFFEHFGTFTIVSAGVSDLFFGWPMAGVIVVAGAIVHGKDA